ncbi:hypothetical protein F2Q70_00014498 [Brassica cretica]|uniref:PPM-type phosphatase domain-containing protein n=1 Tax=Brassica cretica TaxID=69181 RepID=A0A8S9HY57_BRACR|nr:hypothetical protein F2Q70_00014498 [Brassica cretica]
MALPSPFPILFLQDSFIIDLFAVKGNPKSDCFLLQLGELQRPLVSDGDGEHLNQGQTSEEGSREYDLEGACYQNEGILQGLPYKQSLPSSSPHLNQGRTLKHPAEKVSLEDVETDDYLQDNTSQNLQHDLEKDGLSELSPGLVIVNDQISWLCLEVISGPSIGLQFAVHSVNSLEKEKVLSQRDASDVLKDVLAKTEARLEDHLYEGCTATVLLVWKDDEENLFAQCANLGDSACVINLDGRYIQMTEDHRVASLTERRRIQEAGLSLRDNETRIFGINLARMLGDKFPKQHDGRFSAEPYISEPLRIDQSNKDVFAVLASDGLWDVMSPSKAVQLVLQMREKERGTEDSAEKIAKGLLDQANVMRTKDNTSIIYLDFDPSL